MPKFVNLTAALCISFIATLSEVAIIHTTTNAQEYPGCFMIDRAGIFVDLKGLCPLSESASRRVGESEGREELNPLVFSALELKQPILNGNLTQVKGFVTNRSSQPLPLSLISFQLVANERLLASNTIEVAASNGLKPGKSIRFMKLMKQTNEGVIFLNC